MWLWKMIESEWPYPISSQKVKLGARSKARLWAGVRDDGWFIHACMLMIPLKDSELYDKVVGSQSHPYTMRGMANYPRPSVSLI